MELLRPDTPEELSEVLAAAAAAGKCVTLGGNFTKDRMAGAAVPADVTVSTTNLSQIIEYEPKDLTISVQPGMRFAHLAHRLDEDGLMLPLDPPFYDGATIGGVVGANTSGPRRRLYGTPRDVVIGMKFVTLEGKLIHSGGMVVKNAAGLDMAKLVVGSFGTLAAIAAINFRLTPKPPLTRSFVLRFDALEAALETRNRILRSVLQPSAIDLLNPAAARRIGRDGFLLLLQAGGSSAVMNRYASELPEAETLDGGEENELWTSVREFVPRFLEENAPGGVVRVSKPLSELREVVAELDVPAVVRAGSGVCYACFAECSAACDWLAECGRQRWQAVLEFRSALGCSDVQWPNPGSDFSAMERIKKMFDPQQRLNKGRLYGRL